MRLLLATSMTLLFIWLHNAQEPDALHENPCEAVTLSEAAVSLLVTPLSLYSWLTSTLLRLVLSVPALILSCLHHSLLLLLAGPWCVASVCASLLLTCLHVALYLIHIVLVIGVGATLILVQNQTANSDADKEKVLQLQKSKTKSSKTKTRLGILGPRVAKQG